MKIVDLPARQAPLKEKYRRDPKAAKVTLRAQGRFIEGVAIAFPMGKAEVVIEPNPGVGGNADSLCPADLFLDSIAACYGVTLKAVAAHMGIVIREGTVRAEGDLDLRGTLAVSDDTPIGFTRISVTAELDTDAADEQVKMLAAMAEKYAVILQTQACPPRMSVAAVKKA
jgi:uncharacterized OsmC-like protein